jgi:hypothetical protein
MSIKIKGIEDSILKLDDRGQGSAFINVVVLTNANFIA